MPGPQEPGQEWTPRVRRHRPRRKPGPRPKQLAAPGPGASGDPAPRTPPRRGPAQGGAQGQGLRKRPWPECDSDGDPIVPPGGDITQVNGISPYLQRVREGKRGAAGLEEALTRGIRKSRGQRVTPRKRRRRTGLPGQPPTDLKHDMPQEGSQEADSAPCPQVPDPVAAGADRSQDAHVGDAHALGLGAVQALGEGPGPPLAPAGGSASSAG